MRALATLCIAVVAACGGARPAAPPPEPAPPAMFRATVRWTGFGVPHVTAADPAGLGFGQGWASAKQHLCRLADQFVRVRAERARWFGPGADDANVDSDFFHLQLGLDGRARTLVTTMSKDARDLARGWVAGYNHYVEHASWPDGCRDAAWVKPIDELDLARLDLALAAIASSSQFETQIARAAPDDARAASLPPPAPPPLASNGWALGADRTETGGGLVVANPHFPWHGELTFSEIHLTIPGELDVYGVTIPGVPMVAIGFTPKVAWTHTFSSSTRFLIYRLRLVDGDPLRYVRDDGEGRITGKTFEISVRQPDDSLVQVQRTMYRTPHGPMVTSTMTPWSQADGVGYALADVALDSVGSVIDLYLGFARAGGLDDFRAALGFHATPYLNTMFADLDGNAWYVDGSSVPNLSEEALGGWELGRKASPELEAAWRQRLAIVDGSSSMFDLITDDPVAPGAVPLAAAPELLRRDFVFNANDSYGYTNPAAPMTGYSPLYGDATASPSPRGLMNLRMLREKGVSAASGADGYFGLAEAAGAMLSHRSFTGEQLRDLVHTRCVAEDARRATPTKPKKKPKKPKKVGPAEDPAGPPGRAPLAPLCSRLAEWDLRFDVDSRGAVLWRELIQQLGGVDLPWATAFDPAAPSTPSGLAPARAGQPDPVIAALERAVDVLGAAGIDYRRDTPRLGDLQRAAIGSRGEVPGGVAGDGVASIAGWADADHTLLPHPTRAPAVSWTGLGPEGYPVNYGTSWVMAVELRAGGPVANVVLTYGPPRTEGATGPDDDQLQLFARGALRPALFDDTEISADPDLVVEHLEEEQPP